MRLPRRRFLRLAVATAAAAPRIAWAQTYPDRPVRMIVPYAPGGPTDVITRLVAQKLSDDVGKQFFVENMGGGGGNIAMGRAAKAVPDGYTTLVVNPSYVINPTLYGKVPYELERDFDPVTLMVATTLVLAVHPSVSARTVGELVSVIRANPGKFSYASPGTGTPGHLVGEQFRLSLGSTSCMCRSTARALPSARRWQAIRRSALRRRRRPRSRSSKAGCAGWR
jgi:tripartite-type tricarboxylate transporter receptor subunit TctC